MMHNEHKNEMENLLLDLQQKQTRATAFIELTNIADPNSIEPLIGSIKKMTWDEALSVVGHLGNYGQRIIPHLERLIKPSEGPRTYTSAIKGLGSTKTEKAFNILFPLLKREEKWLLSNEVTFGETIDALVSCGKGHLRDLMELLDSSNWLVRSGGVYACGKIVGSNKDRQLSGKLSDKLNTIVMEDRSGKVRNLAAYIVNSTSAKESVKETYQGAMAHVLKEIRKEDLLEKYEEKIKEIFGLMSYVGWSILENHDHWTIKYPLYDDNIFISLARDDITGEGFLKIFIPILTLPSKNILPLYRQMLEWNEVKHTGTAKFIVKEEWIVLEDAKELESVDPPGVAHSIEVLSEMATKYSKFLKDNFL